ncbi:hypothetical protein SAZ10_30320 [Mesorhizobium sp. BAC0120]|uniref:hypothetical protein n=1 Tax=Mesorhizobium sp. BAC0120 TaxID=3090670 RepID=UPI00298CA0DD|nr:hypothetical protein [Mesorhizobium sp. BAC0120]MDW6026063.1 hypothetical protein [Mesorhizobium sp. BAC0120]
MLQLNWISRDTTGQLLRLYDVNLSTIDVHGVYVIYRSGTVSTSPTAIRVGQGDVADRLQEHRGNSTIKAHAKIGNVYVAFASVAPLLIDGVERFLVDRYRPLIGDVIPKVLPVPASLPFAA